MCFSPYILLLFVAPHQLILFLEGQANDSPATQDILSAAVAQQLNSDAPHHQHGPEQRNRYSGGSALKKHIFVSTVTFLSRFLHRMSSTLSVSLTLFLNLLFKYQSCSGIKRYRATLSRAPVFTKTGSSPCRLRARQSSPTGWHSSASELLRHTSSPSNQIHWTCKLI